MENSKKQVINEQTAAAAEPTRSATSPPAPVPAELAELEKLLDFQNVKMPKTAWEHAKRCTSLFKLACDLYNYGYIMGQRAERQRVKV